MNRLNRYGRHTAYRMKKKYREDPFAFLVLWALFFSAIFLVFAFRGLIAVQFMRKIGIDPNAHLKATELTDIPTDQSTTQTTSTTDTQPTSTETQIDSSGTYTVQDGDTLYVIGQQLGKDWKKIAELNELTPPYSLKVGQELKLPA